MKKRTMLLGLLLTQGLVASETNMPPLIPAASPAKESAPFYLVPNFHPASCGWLANWSVERNYCANSYLRHLDKVREDDSYNFVFSECNNMIAVRDFAPERFEELKRRVQEGRVELVNAFFLEPTVNISGGEALAKMGIEGLRWQRSVMGVSPRFCWAIDTCGIHEQMPQICSQLGLEGLVYTRKNPAGSTAFWSVSPDGSRIPTFVPGDYSDHASSFLYGTNAPSDDALKKAEQELERRRHAAPKDAPVLILSGRGDYALPPPLAENPSGILKRWKTLFPSSPLRISTFGSYFDAFQKGKNELPVINHGTQYDFLAFWTENPRIKAWFRRDEHALQSAESIATIASLTSSFAYPVQDLYHAWLQMLLCMDRNTLWGSAGGMVFEDPSSWDASDRLAWVEKISSGVTDSAARSLAGEGKTPLLFNPLNWERHDPVEGRYQAALPSVGLGAEPPSLPVREIPLPETIETAFYSAKLDPVTGSIVSIKTKPSGRELLGGPANVIVAEQGDSGKNLGPGDFLVNRPQRPRIGSSSEKPSRIRVTENEIAFTVEAEGPFCGWGPCRRVIRFNRNYPRIDFETELSDLPDHRVAVAEFPLAADPVEIRRGVPFGFSDGGWAGANPTLGGVTRGIVPAVRWSDYELPSGGGAALLDRGLTGREINGKTAVIYLINALEKYYGYPNSWLSGKGVHRFQYALAVRDGDWKSARIPRMAWEYNAPPVPAGHGGVPAGCSYLSTSDNVIVEAMRREGHDIEVRLAESDGMAGTASVTLNLPHDSAAITDMTGAHPQPLSGGPSYSFPVRPQQIVTLRFRTRNPVPEIVPLLDWSELVPPDKRPALRHYLKDVVGHPPSGK